MTRSVARLRAFQAQQGGAIVVKPVDGYGGLGIFVVRDGDPNASSILETSTGAGTRWTLAQRYLPEVRKIAPRFQSARIQPRSFDVGVRTLGALGGRSGVVKGRLVFARLEVVQRDDVRDVFRVIEFLFDARSHDTVEFAAELVGQPLVGRVTQERTSEP